jgi:chemotaxis protein methyltransferase CheR
MSNMALLDELTQLAARQIGLRIPDDARDRFAAMLREHAAHLGYSLEDYRAFLAGRQASEEWEEFARAFTSGETFFFRDHGQFDLLRLRLLPELIGQHRHDKTLRLWSAGCASGEEVYSLAMLVDMLLPERGEWDILILGTDIDSAAIAKARRAQYGKWSFRMVPPEIQQRYFHSDPESAIRNPQSFVLDERIRRMVTLRVSNLVSEPFPDPASELHDMDLILCRNVFIYFDSPAATAVAAKFAATLREGGYLLTAHTELTGHQAPELESRLFAEGVVYRRRVHAPAEPSPLPLSRRERETIASSREDMEKKLAGKGVAVPSLVRSAGDTHNIPPPPLAGEALPVPSLSKEGEGASLLNEARAHADRGEYEQAEQICHKALAVNPLATAPYFLLAQLAQLKGDFELARDCLNKVLYLDPRFVAAHMELAALCERAGDMLRAQALRRAALGIVRAMPNDEMIEQYETTAGELMQWLAQWEREPAEERRYSHSA